MCSIMPLNWIIFAKLESKRFISGRNSVMWSTYDWILLNISCVVLKSSKETKNLNCSKKVKCEVLRVGSADSWWNHLLLIINKLFLFFLHSIRWRIETWKFFYFWNQIGCLPRALFFAIFLVISPFFFPDINLPLEICSVREQNLFFWPIKLNYLCKLQQIFLKSLDLNFARLIEWNIDVAAQVEIDHLENVASSYW